MLKKLILLIGSLWAYSCFADTVCEIQAGPSKNYTPVIDCIMNATIPVGQSLIIKCVGPTGGCGIGGITLHTFYESDTLCPPSDPQSITCAKYSINDKEPDSIISAQSGDNTSASINIILSLGQVYTIRNASKEQLLYFIYRKDMLEQ